MSTYRERILVAVAQNPVSLLIRKKFPVLREVGRAGGRPARIAVGAAMVRNTLLTAGLLLAAAFLGSGAAAAENLRIGLAEDPDVLDPTLARSFVGRIVFASLCDKLVDITPELEF